MNKRVLFASVIAGALTIAASASAQTSANPGGSGKSSTVEDVIVTGSRPPLNGIPLQAPYSQSSITPEAILNITPSPAMTVQTLLNTQPSIYATTGGTNGMETNIKFRSFSDGEFGETLAGVPLNDIFNSGVTYQADNRNNVLLITRDLDSVDIYRGVNNPSVNTYNSLGGTINYVPRQPTQEMGGDVGVDGGSFNTIDYHATLNTGDWHGVRQTISFERDSSSGWLKNTPDWNDNLYYAAKADVSPSTQLFANFVYNENQGNAPQFIPQNIINRSYSFQWPSNLYTSRNTDNNYLGIVGFISTFGLLTIEDEAYTGDNDYKRTSFSSPDYTGPYFIDDQGSSYDFWSSYMGYNPADTAHGTDYHFYGYNGALYGDRLQLTFDLPFNKVTAGGDYNYGTLHSREYWYGSSAMPMTVGYNDAWDEHDTRTMWSIYVQDDIHLLGDRLHVTPGLKYISASSTDNDALGFYYSAPGSDRADEHFLSPTLGASAEILPQFDIYASYGQNVKFPDITAFYNAIAGPSTAPIVVKPEYAQDFELGARYRLGSARVELNVYDEEFKSIILSSTTPTGFTQYQNGGAERFRGVEFQFTDDFGTVFVGDLKGFANASYNEAVCTSLSNDALAGTSCLPGQSLPNVPRYLVSTGLIWDYDGWHVDLEGQYVGVQQLQDYNTNLPSMAGSIQPGQRTHIPDYILVNLGIIKVIPLKLGPAKALRLGLHVDNLLDQRYFSSAQTNTDANNGFNTATGNQLLDFYGLAGEPRAIFGSVGVFF
jgi:outer membrane receptor protein involved in Fe transport